MSLLYAGGNQPARRSFGIAELTIGNACLSVATRDIVKTPFYRLVEFSVPSLAPQAGMLVVAPLSGHFPVIARDLIAGLLPYFRVYVTDWVNVRHVPARYGSFGFAKNIAAVRDMIKRLDRGITVLGLCQGGVPALAATALLAGASDTKTPASLVLMASPIDPLANPTKVVQLLRERPLSWFETNMIARVPAGYAGHGRSVHSAHARLLPLWAYLARHITGGTDTGRKVFLDDGDDPVRFPFLDLYTSIMDLDAAYFLENTRDVFHECVLPRDALYLDGERAAPRAIRNTALLTIEGERDDIAAPGQTSAAHRLCSALPERFHRSLVVSRAGHFSLFYGNTWRGSVLPVIQEFCISRRPGKPASRSLVPVH